MKRKQSLKLGISSCLLGNNVRYDGGHKFDRYLCNTLGQFVEWVPICPEAACGLSIPREAMHLAGDPDSPRLMTRETGIDHTKRTMQFAENRLAELVQENLCGFVFKARSPSCGVRDTKLSSRSGRIKSKRAGLFAEAVMRRFPLMPVADEEEMRDSGTRENFLERVFVYVRWQELIAQGGTISQLIAFHMAHKYVLMSHSPKHLKELGALVADSKTCKRAELLERYGQALMHCLKQKATIRKQVNVLRQISGYFTHHLLPAEKIELQGAIAGYLQGLIPLIVPIALLNHYVRKYDDPCLKQQHYLNPHPLELMLRNHA